MEFLDLSKVSQILEWAEGSSYTNLDCWDHGLFGGWV